MAPYIFRSSNTVNGCEKSLSGNIKSSSVTSNEGRSHITNAAVIFDTRYAKSLEAGLKRANIVTFCINAEYVINDLLRDRDLICIGAPTHFLSASKSTKKFLAKIKSIDLSAKTDGSHGFI